MYDYVSLLYYQLAIAIVMRSYCSVMRMYCCNTFCTLYLILMYHWLINDLLLIY